MTIEPGKEPETQDPDGWEDEDFDELDGDEPGDDEPDDDEPDGDEPDGDEPDGDEPRPPEGLTLEDLGAAPPASPENARCGYVALVGAPNAGKSTLLNAMVGIKLSIVSPKVQTTRRRVLGILTEAETQLVFVDTPGIFTPRKRLERAMVSAAWQGAEDADLVVLLVDASRHGEVEENRAILSRIAETGRPAILALNKIDLIRRDKLLGLSEALNRDLAVQATFMISALNGSGLDDLRAYLAAHVPAGPWLFPADQLSDLPERMLASEVTREKLFIQLHQELPYSSTVETEAWEEFKDGSARISQVIYVQRESQRAIVIGRGGQRLRSIGETARKELEVLFERRIHLKLFVKVREGWLEDPERYREMGLEYDAKG